VQKANTIILIVAVLMGLGAVYLARDWVTHQSAVSAKTSTITVASTRMGFGAELTRDNVVQVSWAAETIPDGAFATLDDLFKDGRRTVLTPIDRNEPILRGKITGPGQRASLSALLEPGSKAVTLRVDDVRGVAGFVLPGDRVDVVLIRSESRASGQTENSSDILVQYVKVLAVDQIANERQEQATVAKAVTLEVSTEDAQKILLASNVGRLSLILRQAGQAQLEAAKRVTDVDLGGPVIVPARPPVKRNQDIAIVDIVRGSKRESYSIQRMNN
jgi:pilus assembly protein CpaB